MAGKYEISELAATDLKEAWAYIAEHSFESADRLLDELTQKFQLLADNPTIGRERYDFVVGMRSFPYKKYVIYYFPTENGMEIYRVFHSARNIEDSFEDYFEGLKP